MDLGSMVENGKPAPDIYKLCASKFDPKPETLSACLAFEDSPAGVKSGISAGMKVEFHLLTRTMDYFI